VETVKALVTEGADMFLKNKRGRDAVWEAEQRGNDELVGWMLAFGEEKPAGEMVEEEGLDEQAEMPHAEAGALPEDLKDESTVLNPTQDRDEMRG
jgi:hypothetical protein